LTEVEHGEEKSEEGEKSREEEKKESSKAGIESEVRKEAGKENGGQKEIRGQEAPEGHDRESCGQAERRNGGTCGSRSLHGCGARGENRPQSRGSVAFSDRLEALVGGE
jgi:hypothetical protein